MGKPAEEKKEKTFHWFLLAAIIIVLYFSSVLISQQFYLNQVNRDQASADARLQEAQKENAALREAREMLSDPAYIERIAREELGMTRPDEIPYSTVRKGRN